MKIIEKIELDFNVICNVCGCELDANVYSDEIIIHPCETCIEKAKEDGIRRLMQ